MSQVLSKRNPWLDRLTPSRPFVVLGLAYIVGILFFALFRATFFLVFRDQMAEATVDDYLISFLIGWRFDQVVVLWILLPLLITVTWVGLQRRWSRTLIVIFLSLSYSLMTILLLADMRFFKYLHSHLNFQAVQYASQGGQTTWHLIVSEPMFAVNLALWAVLTAALVFVWLRIVRMTRGFPDRRSWTGQILWFVIFLSLTALGIRGRTSISPIDWGVAYFSENHFLNQSALNGIYTLGRAFTEEGHDPRVTYLQEPNRYPFVPFQDGLDSLKGMLGGPDDTWLEPQRSLLRTTKQTESRFAFKPNIVLVIMESWSGRFTGTLGAPDNLTPHFDSMAAHGILFTNFYASGIRTNYGLPAVLCSFPAMPGRSIMTRYNANHPFVSISELLHDRGYTNLLIYGGDLVFDNMKGFFATKRYNHFYGDQELGTDEVFAKWGIPDHIVFHKATQIADSSQRPFQMTVLTLSNHEPFDLPDSSVQRFSDGTEQSRIRNAQVYADYALGSFMAEMKSKPAFDSTIFVFTSDHALWGHGKIQCDPTDFKIPLLIYSPALLGDTGATVTTIGGQVDVIPTLIGILGGEYTHQSWGRDLLRIADPRQGYAITNANTTISLTEGGFLYVESLERPPFLYKFADTGLVLKNVKQDYPDQVKTMQLQLRTYIQIADQLSTPTAALSR